MSEPKHKVKFYWLDDNMSFDIENGKSYVVIPKPRYDKDLSDNQISIIANQIYKLSILFKNDSDDEKFDVKAFEKMLTTFLSKYTKGNTTAKHFLKTWFKEDFWFNE